MEYAGMIRMMDRYGSLDQFVNVDFFLSFLILSSHHIYTFCLLVSLYPSLSLSHFTFLFVSMFSCWFPWQWRSDEVLRF